MTDFEVSTEPAPVSEWNESKIWILRGIPMVSSTLYVLVRKNAIPLFTVKGISSKIDISTDDNCYPLLPEFKACGSSQSSDVNDVT